MTPGWIRALVRLLPREMREEYGDEIAATAAARLRDGATSTGREAADLLGAVVRERIHQAGRAGRSIGTGGGGEPMGTLLQDIRYAFRMLIKTPVVSTVAALSLALGIAGTAAALSLSYGFLFSSVPWDDGDRLVNITMENPQVGAVQGAISPASYLAFAEEHDGLFDALTYTEPSVTNVAEEGADPEQIQMVGVDGSFHRVVATTPALGRGIVDDDLAPSAEPVAVLMHEFWERRYGSDPGVLGRRILMAGTPHTIIGVMPEDFELIPANVHALRGASLEGRRDDHRRALLPLARLAEGVTTDQASARLRQIQTEVEARDPDAYENWTVGARHMADTFPGPQDRILIHVLLAVALFGLLIACANVANLLLGRAEERQREVSVRTALGAPRGRIIAQLLTESVVLASIAGALGLGGAVFLVDWFSLSMPAEMPRALYPALAPPVIAVAVGVTLLAGILFGLAPALHAVRGDLRHALSGSRGGTAERGRQRLRNGFVVAEFAVAVGLLTGATMLVRALGAIAGGEPGFQVENVMTFTLQPLEDTYADDASLHTLRTDVLAALEARPEIARAVALTQLPRAPFSRGTAFTVQGQEAAPEEIAPAVAWVGASPGYLDTYDIPLRSGRWFGTTDRAEAEPVLVVTEAFAERYFPGETAVGRFVTLEVDRSDDATPPAPRRVVGVVADVALQRLEVNAVPSPAVYVPIAQVEQRASAFAVRLTGDDEGIGRVIRDAVATVDRSLPVGALKSMDAHVDEQLAGPRLIGLFVGGIGLVALILAALGIYGVMSHSVVQRTREIGIRMAMGAERRTVIGMVTRSGLGLVAVGMVVGIPLAWVMSRVTLSVMGDITEVFPIWEIASTVAVLLMGVALVACLIPAFRASTVRPARALARE